VGGKCVDIQNGVVAQGTKVVLNGCNPQSLTLKSTRFTSGISSGLCLDDWLGAANTNPDIYTCNNSTAQVWLSNGDGTLRTVSGGCLANSQPAFFGSAPVKLAVCNDSDAAQQWVVSSNTIKNPATGACLDDPGSSSTSSTALDLSLCVGTNAQKWVPSTSTYTDPQQQWAKTYHNTAKTGVFELTSAALNAAYGGKAYCMDVSFSGTADGTAVQYWDCDATAAQYWTAGADGSLVNVNSGKCLDTTGGSSTDGTQLVINTCNGSASQKWTTP
jgi:beta-glucosidase